ncbi:MAG: aminodeoxychorismate synthase component I [Deltaproteobacteria bacterium]|nr:aminodeoxychorismate synthase component I [Deltaproteobacteria bacterium]
MFVRFVEKGRLPSELLPLARRFANPFLLDSAAVSDDDGATSFLGCDPIDVIDARDLGSGEWRSACDRLDALRDPRATGWNGARPGPRAVGFLSYELGEHIEPKASGCPRPGGAPSDLCFGVYDAVYRWDHATGTASIEADSRKAAEALEEKLLHADPKGPRPFEPLHLPAPVSSLDEREFEAIVDRALEYIRAGDIYQVNLARRLEIACEPDPGALYARLRRSNPASFGAFLDLAGIAVLSTSPERYLSWDRATGRIETRPIKGTRPRGRTPAEDRALAAELERDAKERAEHVMIVDLERSDLGRIARIGTVAVSRYARVQSLARVHHLVSDVTAVVREGVGLADVLDATFPGGSITGAPKVRAMQILAELEPVRRGVYTGAIGYVDRAGGCDLAIPIRTVVVQGSSLSFHVGAGIVADSDPAREWRETADKAQGILDALY